MYYTIYKITNIHNGHFYIGAHKTFNIDDGYMGSGSQIKSAIKEYGIDSFNKEILHIFESAEEMYEQEKVLLAGTWRHETCYNQMPGGYGGGEGTIWADTPNNAKAASDAGNSKLKKLWATDPAWARSTKNKMSQAATRKNFMKGKIHIRRDQERKIIHPDEWPEYEKRGWTSYHQRQLKMKRRWVNNGLVNKIVDQEQYMHYINNNWEPGRISK